MYDARRPFHNAIAVNVASTDQTPTQGASNGIYIGGAGNLVCILKNASASVTFTGLLAGQIYDLQISTVVKASTTITNSLLLY